MLDVVKFTRHVSYKSDIRNAFVDKAWQKQIANK